MKKEGQKQEKASDAQIEQNPTKKILGRIAGIDEDSFAISGYDQAANFEFEHIRIRDGIYIHKLIFPGPSNYAEGDIVRFEYQPMSRITYEDLMKMGAKEGYWNIQEGYFDNIKGVIVRKKPNTQ